MPILGTPACIGYNGTKVMAMDPGSNTVGLAIINVYPNDPRYYLEDTVFLHAKRFMPKDSDILRRYGERAARIEWLKHQFGQCLNIYQPDCFIAEAPYMGKQASAFEALVEARTHFKIVLGQYDPLMFYHYIDPKSVKVFMGAVDNSKPAMRAAVLSNQNIVWPSHIDRENLTEHEYDAIAVGCFYVNKYV